MHDVGSGTISVNLGIEAGLSLSALTYQGASIVSGNNTGTETTKVYLGFVTIASGSVEGIGTNTGATIFLYRLNKNGVPDYGTPSVTDWWPF